MKKKNKKKNQIIICLTLCSLLFLGAFQVNAKEKGTAYVVTVSPSYSHPITGQVLDPGNNPGIGQGMTQSVCKSQGLLESTKSGNYYLTLRIAMLDNVSKLRFAVQKSNKTAWTDTSSKEMQKNVGGTNVADYRIKIPSKDAIVKITCYVEAMGRDVIFFANFSGMKEGSSDFVVSVTSVDETESAKTATATTNERTKKAETSDNSSNQSKASTTESNKRENAADTAANTNANNAADTAANTNTNNATDTAADTKISGVTDLSMATGLTLSNPALLNSNQEGNVDSAAANVDNSESENSTASTNAGEENSGTENAQEETQYPPMSWIFVLQCILIITIPCCVVTILGSIIVKKMF